MTDDNTYFIIPKVVMRDSTLTPFARLIFAELLCLSRKTGYAFVGQGTLANWYGVTRNTIKYTIKSLEEKGYIKVHRERTNQHNKANKIEIAEGVQINLPSGQNNFKRCANKFAQGGQNNLPHKNINKEDKRRDSNFSPSGEKEEEELSGYDLFVQWQKEHEPKPPAPPQWG